MGKRISAGISQIGGKFMLVNTIREYIPYHEFFLSPFCGACWVEFQKPRCRYECFNDLNAELINYLLVIREHPKEFDELKQGVFGLVSQEICNRIVRGELLPQNNIERAYFFYYLNKLTFGGSVQKGYGYMIDNHNLSREGYGRVDSKVVENAKQDYEWKTKGYIGIHREGFTGSQKNYNIENSPYRGVVLPTVCKDKSVNEVKSNYRGITPKCANYGGIILSGTGRTGNSPGRTNSIGKAKERYKQAQIKGINPKTT